MEVKQLELYHVHLLNNTDRKWKVNNTIIVDNNFESVMMKRHKSFQVSVDVGDHLELYHDIALNTLLQIQEQGGITKEDVMLLQQLVDISKGLSFNANFFKREASLEDCRRDSFSELPSRLHSMYLCDKDGLEYWEDTISEGHTKEYETFKVLAEGNIFKTNEQLLPNELLSYQDAYSKSFKYWRPKFKDVPDYTNEYLAQGKIKILEKK